jgi:hypothetical protein
MRSLCSLGLGIAITLMSVPCTRAVGQPLPLANEVVRADVVSVLGVEAHSSSEDSVGRIVDILAGPDGNVEAAIIEVGGFLGIGTRQVAVAWSSLHFYRHGTALRARIAATREELYRTPQYHSGRSTVVVHQPTEQSHNSQFDD